MGKKKSQLQTKSVYVPTVGNGGIQKKVHPKGQQAAAPIVFQPPLRVAIHRSVPPPQPPPVAPSAVFTRPPLIPHPLQSNPPLSSIPLQSHPIPPPSFPPPLPLFTPIPSVPHPSYGQPPPPLLSLPPNVFSTPPMGAPRPSPVGLVTTPLLAREKTSPTKKNLPKESSQPPTVVNSVTTKKAQLKYARQLAATINSNKNEIPKPVVKQDPDAPKFNIFMNIAQRYRTKMSSPEMIDIVESEEEEEHIEDIDVVTGEQQTATITDANMTIVDNMSICTVDEVGEETIDVGEKEGEEKNEGGGEGMDGKGDEGGRIDEDEDEIVCLGEQKSTHVMSETVLIDDDEIVEMKEEEVMKEKEKKEAENGRKKANGKNTCSILMQKSVMDGVIIDLSYAKETTKNTVSTTSKLPEFIPLIDDGKNEKTKKNKKKNAFNSAPAGSVRPVQQVAPVVQQQNSSDLSQLQPIQPSHSSFPYIGAPIAIPKVMTSKQKGRQERKKKDKERKRADMRAMELGASPATIASAISASTCTVPSLPFSTPSKIPLPSSDPPPTPLSHLFRYPPGSRASSAFFHPPSTSSSSMAMIQSRGISTSAPHAQPVNRIGMPAPPGLVGGSSTGSTTLASVLADEVAGVVRDSLTASGAYRRMWEEKRSIGTATHADTKVDPHAAPFRICSYNVLCQKTISSTDYLYRHTRFQPHVLNWSHRWPLIQRELRELNADIFGLQEIQDIHFEQYYEPFMKSLGYVCLFQKKSETQHADGLGIFVKGSRFKIAEMNTVDFLVRGDKLLDRGNVAQLLRVECLQTGASLIVSNTHILFNERRGDVKLAQIALLMAKLHAMRKEDEPVVCLGDWNLEPASDLYNYITSGSLDASTFIPRYGSGQLREGRNFNIPAMNSMPTDTHVKTKMSRDGILYENEGALRQSLRNTHPSVFSHQIPLTSTYAPYRERQVSTYHKDIANPDFIFYTTAGRGEQESSRLRLIRRLGMPPEANIRQFLEPWPNNFIPSDHIPLMAEFYLSK